MAKVRKSHSKGWRRTIRAGALEGHDRDSEKSTLQTDSTEGVVSKRSGHKTLAKLGKNSAAACHRSDSPQSRHLGFGEDIR